MGTLIALLSLFSIVFVGVISVISEHVVNTCWNKRIKELHSLKHNELIIIRHKGIKQHVRFNKMLRDTDEIIVYTFAKNGTASGEMTVKGWDFICKGSKQQSILKRFTQRFVF